MALAVAEAQRRAREVVHQRAEDDVREIERLASAVQAADNVYRDHQEAAQLAELNGAHRDMVASALADRTVPTGIHDLADWAEVTAQAVRLALQDIPAETLALPPEEHHVSLDTQRDS